MLPIKKIILFIVVCSIFAVDANVYGQVCQGSFGDPVVHIDFGRGSSFFGPPLDNNKTNYKYIPDRVPYDGYYTIEKSVSSGSPWNAISNHTPNDPDGYLMMINASFDPGIFYETAVETELCPNTTYEFAAWVANIGRGNGITPNLVFKVLTMDDQVLGTDSTGNIPEDVKPVWKQRGFLFRTGGNVSQVKIRIINNAPGGSGNDIVLDDITFRACGPAIAASIDNSTGQTEKTICNKDNVELQMNAAVAGSATLQYLWQKKDGGTWTDLSGETSLQLKVDGAGLPAGDHEFRMVAAENTNFNSPACRTASAVLTVHVLPLPDIAVISPQVVCIGDPVKLDVTGTAGTYEWTGPNGFSSAEKSPVLNNSGFTMSGDYTVKVSSGGCSASAVINVNVVPPPVAAIDEPEVSVCEGRSVSLNASGGTLFQWSPATGLSDPGIANPIASPVITTLYTVSVSNGGCADTARVIVTVFKKITASAGKNRAVIEGQSVTLDGHVTGDKLKYFWTPSDYLDDPAKLNPIATPLKDITYTLSAWSEENCSGSTSSVLIKVYPRLTIPNTFSPNGDGINDIWNIDALEAYPNATIDIYNRYGEKVFSSTSGLKQWNGKYKGKDVPEGVYYYAINLREPERTITGAIMVLR